MGRDPRAVDLIGDERIEEQTSVLVSSTVACHVRNLPP
jgi:hypothetical protein